MKPVIMIGKCIVMSQVDKQVDEQVKEQAKETTCRAASETK